MLRYLLRSTSGRLPLAGLVLLGSCACRSAPPKAPAPEPSPEPKVPVSQAPALSLAPNPPILLQEVGFQAPTAALYDVDEDVYLVANANGNLSEADGNGFISRVAPDGSVLALKWIDGATGAGLDAPKGMALSGDKLYVADLNVVRSFHRKSGEALGKISVPSARYLADLALAQNGSLYVSDTGLVKRKKGQGDLEPTGADAVFAIDPSGAVTVFNKSTELGQPTALLVDSVGLWLVNLRGELQHWSMDGKPAGSAQLPAARLQGLVEVEAGKFLLACSETSTVYVGESGTGAVPERYEALITELTTPGDITYDRKRRQLIVPLTRENALCMQEIPGG
jgi:hypothetical protein